MDICSLSGKYELDLEEGEWNSINSLDSPGPMSREPSPPIENAGKEHKNTQLLLLAHINQFIVGLFSSSLLCSR